MDEYVSQQKIQLLDSLENQVRFSQLVAVVVGDSGIGKTFLLNQLQRRLGNEVQFARIDASLAMSAEQLDKTISLQLGLSWQSSSSNLAKRIKDSASQKVVICIDNAELLSIECLNFSLNLNQQQLQTQDAVLFVLLAGNKILPEMISKTDIFSQHKEMCVVFEIEAIQQNETRSLVLALKNFNADIIEAYCDEKKLNYFWQLSKGNPSELDYHIERWLEKYNQTEVVEIKDGSNTSYLKGIIYGLVTVILVSVLIFQQQINQWIDNPVNQSDEKIVLQNKPEQTPPIVDEPVNKSVNKSSGSEKRKQKVKNTVNHQDDLNNGGTLAEDAKNISFSNQQRATREQPEEIPTTTVIMHDKSKVSNQPIEKIKDNVDELGLLIEQIDQKKIETPSSKPKVVTTIKPANRVRLTAGEQSLLAEPSTHFALQWVGLSQLAAAKQYREKHPLKSEMIIYRRKTSGKVLYLVVSGSFANLVNANSAKLKYHESGYLGKPWAKSLKAIQKEIQSFKTIK